jgi:hypothetical protein
MLAEMGEHQLTIRDYLRHSNLHVTNKYLQATPERKRLAQAGWFAAGEQINSHSVVGCWSARSRIRSRECAAGGVLRLLAYWTQTDPDFFLGLL